jgi:alpha-ketoglutarate-dependent taurine dioxygenase
MSSFRRRNHHSLSSSVSGTNCSIGTRLSRCCLQQVRFHNESSHRPHATLLPKQYLNAYDPKIFDPSTHQRNDVLFNPIDGTPPTADSYSAPKQEGAQEHSTCNYEESWLSAHLDRWRADPSDFDSYWPVSTNEMQDTESKATSTKRILWSNWDADFVRDRDKSPILFQYDDVAHDEDKNVEKRLLKAFYQYGLVLITGTPSATDSLPEEVMTEATKTATNAQERAEEAILHFASTIGYHPLQTLYGRGVWSTSSYSSFYNSDDSDGQVNAASTADSAYGSTSLPLHTDMTYMSTPPGVQIFLMVQPATGTRSASSSDQDSTTTSSRGQSIYLDGFAAAEQLRTENPEAFHLLASTQRRYRCIDDAEGWHLEACGPIINAIPREDGWGPVTSIRHNDLDRLPDLPPYPSQTNDSNFTSFYDELLAAHAAWDNILRRDEMRLVIDLKCGDCVLVSNHRCMHGRYAFDASSFPRVVMGCYVGMDELCSKWRRCGFSF